MLASQTHSVTPSTTGQAEFVPASYRGFVISSGFAWAGVSLPTTAPAKRGGTIPIHGAHVCIRRLKDSAPAPALWVLQAKKRARRMISKPSKGERCLVPRPGERCYSIRPSEAPDAGQSCFPGAGCRRAFLRRASLLRAPVPVRHGRFPVRCGRYGWRFHSRCTGSAR